jgi:biopolymer transport protein ExbB/TolQ
MALVFILGVARLLKGSRKLKRIKKDKLIQLAKNARMPNDPLELIAAKTLYTATMEYNANPSESYSKTFLNDATRQLVENYFESKFVHPISMCSNILPPMGFIGTVLGMIIIFVAKGQSGHELNLEGLSIALLTTLFALVFFVILELLKIYLIKLATTSIDSGLSLDLNSLFKEKHPE